MSGWRDAPPVAASLTIMLVLASTSVYRRELLGRLRLPFATFSPCVDETPLSGEAPEATALRLAQAKARAAAVSYPASLIIGSDQVAELDGLRLDKPGSRDRAQEQLQRASGREVVFHTAVTLLEAHSGRTLDKLVPTRVRFRALTASQISAYLDAEQPYDCAGSAKSEGLGIALLEQIQGEDPTALIGLPLIAVVSLLQDAGLSVL
jgi:septum formation protein